PCPTPSLIFSLHCPPRPPPPFPTRRSSDLVQAFEAGCHVFLEKPVADTVEGALRVADAARRHGKKLVVGYILRYHPSWQKFVELDRKSTRLNSSHVKISYAVFCLKKKK